MICLSIQQNSASLNFLIFNFSSNMYYIAHLSKDRKLAKFIVLHQPFNLKSHKNICLRLCASIMSQQLSTKVAQVLYRRFLEIYEGNEPTPEQIVATPFEK